MANIKIAVKGNRAALIGNIDLVAGTVGQVCNFYFDDEWRSLPSKKITYKVGSTLLGTYDIIDAKATIPSSVLSTAGLPLEIGITGYSFDKSTITPTSWCLIGTIKQGTIIIPPSNNNDVNHIIYDGGLIIDTNTVNSNTKHINYDGGVIY